MDRVLLYRYQSTENGFDIHTDENFYVLLFVVSCLLFEPQQQTTNNQQQSLIQVIIIKIGYWGASKFCAPLPTLK